MDQYIDHLPRSGVGACIIVLRHGRPQYEDLELTRRSQAGDVDAFGELVTKYRARILTVVYGMVSDEQDAWDIAQEAFLNAWRSINSFSGRSSFYTWLYRITVNLLPEPDASKDANWQLRRGAAVH